MSQEQRRRPILNVGTVLLAVLLIAAAIGAVISVGRSSRAGSDATGARGSLGAPLIITTTQQGAVNCPYGASFSPDGEYIAVLGSQGTCDQSSESLTPHIAAIFGAHSGVTSLYVRLDRVLDKVLDFDDSDPLSQQAIRAISYFNLGWSPDSKYLAITYTAFNSAESLTPTTVAAAGLILLNTERGTARVLQGDSGFFTLPGTAGSFPIWNIASGEETPMFSPDPGLAYAWNTHGAPYPIVRAQGDSYQLPITAGPRYPVGNPNADSTFTIWQPGVILGSSSDTNSAIFTTVFPSWSPDGKHVTLITAGAQLPLAQAPSKAQKSARGRGGEFTYPTPTAMSAVPARDAALAAVQRSVSYRGWALVAWNPSGTLLASINCQAPGNDQLDIRATDSGIIQGSASLHLPSGDSGCHDLSSGASAYPAQPMMVLWSPTGDRVMVCDQRAGTLTIWPVNQPQA